MIARDDLDGLPVADSLVGHTPTGTVHAVRPAAPHYLVSIPEDMAARPVVRLVRHHLGETDERGRWRVTSHLVPRLVTALTDRDDDALASLVDLNPNQKEKNS